MRLIDLTGKHHGRLTVLRRSAKNSNGNHPQWECVCQCGKSLRVLGDSLHSGNTTSCGCFKAEFNAVWPTTHGMKNTRTYRSWCDMKARCTNPNKEHYEDYGGRGIKVCGRWKRFENFLKDMGECPPRLTIERVNNDGNYCPSNCIWASRKIQANNQRPKKRRNLCAK